MNVIHFSGGRSSAYMTKRLIDEGMTDFVVLFQNTGKESPETLDFVNQCDIKWNLNIVWLEYRYGNNFEVVNYETASRDGRPFDEVIAHKKHFLPNQRLRYCTTFMKIDTLRRYLKSIHVTDYTSFNGIRYDEPRRWAKIEATDLDIELPLVKWKVTKKDVLDWWKVQDFDLMVNEPYGNCDCCFLKGKGKLTIIAQENPELFEWWINHETNSTFKKDISYQQIKDKAESQFGLWDNDPSFECFCNVD
jgi:3'-phosphoadenosine 5'-phosphosulfate sulfotransferase (PAPS reductase)/FAD synthetase